jgi:hypothetical protein
VLFGVIITIIKTNTIETIALFLYTIFIKVPYIVICFMFNKQIIIDPSASVFSNTLLRIASRTVMIKFKFFGYFYTSISQEAILLENGSRPYNNMYDYSPIRITSLIPFDFNIVDIVYTQSICNKFKKGDILRFKKDKKGFIVKFIELLPAEKCILVEVPNVQLIESNKLNIIKYAENGPNTMYISFNDCTYSTKYQFLDNYKYIGRPKLKLKDFLNEC